MGSIDHIKPSIVSLPKQAVSPAHEVRLLSRHNLLQQTGTAGLAGQYLQANLIVLPSAHAADFRDLCAQNPVPCPLLGWTLPSDPTRVYPAGCITAPDFDVRTDFLRYRVLRSGTAVDVKTDILQEWTDDHVAFLIGCSYSFEMAIKEKGLRVCHEESGTRVAMYRTKVPLLPAGVFYGSGMVVSMRYYREADIETVRAVCRPYLATHGEPVAWGWEGARLLGIEDVDKPDSGNRQMPREGEVPVFWACGVTPQVAVEAAAERIQGVAMVHDPGYMLLTDWTVDDLPRLASGMRMEGI